MNTMNEEALGAVTGGAGGTTDPKVKFVQINCVDCANNKSGQVCPHQDAEAAKAAQSSGYHCQFKKATTSACFV